MLFFRSTTQKPNLKVLLQITERCNLKCKHCFVSSLPEGFDLKFEKIENEVLPKLKAANVTRVTITGGEPMVHKDILKIIKMFDDNNMHITLCTNGLGLNEEKIKYLYNNIKDIHVNVSLDGFSSKSHGKFRGNESEVIFNKIIENIKLLSKYNLLNGIMCSPNKYSSIEEYIELCKFAKQNEANYILFNPLSKFGRGEYTQNIAFTREELMDLREEIEKLELEDDKFQTVFIRIPRKNSDKLLTSCNPEITYIFTNGDVAVCPYLVFASENDGSQYQRKEFLYGNIFENEFDLLKRINEYQLPEKKENPKCSDCGMGCKAMKVAYGLSLDACDPEMCKK